MFTVQDVLADPPFSRLDLISCRNLMIYLGQEAQAKIVSIFHFALREGGTLLLGSAETIGNDDGRFAVISKPERLYKNLGRGRAGNLAFSLGAGEPVRLPARTGQTQAASHNAIAELCRRLVMEYFAPAAILINRKQECYIPWGQSTVTYMCHQGIPPKIFSPWHPRHQDEIAVGHPASQSDERADHRCGRPDGQ